MSATTPPGWYPDPGHTGDGPAPERRWDGTAWTGETRSARDITVPDGVPTPPPEPSAPPGPGGTAHMATLPGDQPLAPPPAAPPSPYATAPYTPYGQGAAPTPYGAPLGGHAPYPPPAPSGGGQRTALIAGAIVVVAALAVGLVVLLGSGDDEEPEGRGPAPSASAEGPSDEPAPEGDDGAPGDEAPPRGESDEPGDPEEDPRGDGSGGGDGGLTTATAGGLVLPLLDGWSESQYDTGFGVTTGDYACPGDSAMNCVRAGAFVSIVPGAGDVPAQDYVSADIGANESESYNPETYGAVTAREELLSEAVTIAGQEGHRIRSRIETASGTAAFVESVAFPAPDGSGDLVVLRLGFDIGEESPPEDDMDRLVRGAEATSAGGPGTQA
ncbi:DUF2510 domain-containing protein [Streptomyces radicis]|uniref:DUF2510 domain-containing protein n=1 Tax=Streptomyces radicis TaxID=1750517 RepID=UPI001602249E|nr:DUF2510 domain-containing protein [Streptomyces radicis]